MIPNLTRRAFQLMAEAPVDGCLVEFGVNQGGGLISIGRHAERYLAPVPPIFGFDTFSGMPQTKMPLDGDLAADWGPGTFSDTSVERVSARLAGARISAKLVPGAFADLGALERYGIGHVRFAHIDPDLYEGYRDALRLLTPHIGPGTVLLFDEIIAPSDPAYQGVLAHGKRAVDEWVSATGFNLHLIAFEWTVALCVIVDAAYLAAHRSAIEKVRRTTVGEAATRLVRGVLGR